jgi:hypothetical protein
MALTRSEHERFIASIAANVMRALEQSGFFAKLDDALSPIDSTHAPESCKGDYRLSESIALGVGIRAGRHGRYF